MKHWKPIILLLAALAASATARADDKAALARAKAAFEKQDAALNTVYKALIATLDKTAAAELRKDEKDWLQYRDDMTDTYGPNGDADDPKATVDYWKSMADFTSERTEFLRAWTGRDVPPGITGEYSDCHGGSLLLEETKAGVKFDITAVRRRSAANGELTGVIHIKDNTARYVEKLDDGEEGPPCELTFTFVGGHIAKITQKGRDPGAGEGVYYDGSYYKIGKLKKPVELQ